LKLFLLLQSRNVPLDPEVHKLIVSLRANPEGRNAISLVKNILSDPSIQLYIESIDNQLVFYDGAKKLFQSLERIASTNYSPSASDVACCFLINNGIMECGYELSGKQWHVVDAGKNIETLSQFPLGNVVTIVLTVDISSYAKISFQRPTDYSIKESLAILNELGGLEPVVIVFNKIDIFDEYIKKYDPKSYGYEDYDGGLDREKALNYFKRKFIKLKPSAKQDFHIIEGSLTNINDAERIFNISRSIALYYFVRTSKKIIS